MNAFASRGVEGVGFGRVMRKPRLSKRPRTFVAALIGTWVAFMWLVNRYYHKDEATVWIWMGIRSDDRCGRDFGTDHVQHTTCGKGSCCSSHGWCGTTARQHRPSPHTLRALTSLAARSTRHRALQPVPPSRAAGAARARSTALSHSAARAAAGR